MNCLEPVELCARLIAFDTSNPPGDEAACARYLAALLSNAGFAVSEHPFGRDRLNLLARRGPRVARRSLLFVGHLDTVPRGDAAWRHEPFKATVENGRLYGRGACDMKSGVAAFVAAALQAAPGLASDAALTLLLTGGEETGCEGSLHFARECADHLEGIEGVIVAEPTDNEPLLGHKGALWLRLAARGVSAHGAMPQFGVNAAVKAARMVLAMQDFCAPLRSHPVLGKPTISVGCVRAGHAVNVVPDSAAVDIDIRTTPDLDHAVLRKRLARLLADDLDRDDVLASLPGVYSDPRAPWLQTVLAAVARASGRESRHATADYFTDASALSAATRGAPILILGPGSPSLMHQTDEYCELAKIDEARRIYSTIIAETLAGSRERCGRVAEQA